MKHRKALTALVLALALVGAFSLVSYAANGLQEISAYLNSNITVKLDGETKTLTDATGARTYPITYNGTTYVPLRSVANLLGIDVNWDQDTQTVLLGATATDLFETFKPYTHYESHPGTLGQVVFVQSSDGLTRSIGGETVNHWLTQKTDAYGGGCVMEVVTSFNLGGKYKTLTFKAYSDEDITLTVKGDNDFVLGEYSLVGGQTPQTFTVDLRNTTQLTFVRGRQQAVNDISTAKNVNTSIFSAMVE